MDARTILGAALCAAMISALADAQERTQRRNELDFTIGLPHLQSATTTFEDGTVVDTGSSTGLGFNFDWRFADRWSAGATLAMHDIDYTANIAPADGAPSSALVVQNDLDTQSLMGHVKRYFGTWDRVTPYASGALGWVTIDTNIATGPPVGYCWFDPWWGPRCSTFQPTRTMTEAGTALGFGVRWEFSRRVFLDASVGREWIDLDNSNRPDFTQVRIAFGMRQASAAAGR